MKIQFIQGILHAIPENEGDLHDIINALRRTGNKDVISFGIAKSKNKKVKVILTDKRCKICGNPLPKGKTSYCSKLCEKTGLKLLARKYYRNNKKKKEKSESERLVEGQPKVEGIEIKEA